MLIVNIAMDNKISVECVGNPEFYDDEEHDPSETECRVYSFDKLPGDTAIFKIKNGPLSCHLNYTFYGLTLEQLTKFINAMKSNDRYSLSFRPGANQDASIITQDGQTYFTFNGAGGDCPTDFTITVPNCNCLDAFINLLPKE